MPDMPQKTKTAVVNPQLQQAIAKVKAENTPQNVAAMITALLRAVLITPVAVEPGTVLPKPDAQGRIALSKETKLSFGMLKAPDGNRYFIAFTDNAALQANANAPQPKTTVLLRLADYAELLRRNPQVAGFIIDPFTSGVQITRQMIENLGQQLAALQAQRTAAIQPGDDVTIVEPSVLPDALLDPVCAALTDVPNVTAAYFQIMIRNKTERSYLIVLEGTAEKAEVEKVVQAAKPYLLQAPQKMNLTVTMSASALGQQGMQDAEPFYRKGTGRLREDDEQE